MTMRFQFRRRWGAVLLLPLSSLSLAPIEAARAQDAPLPEVGSPFLVPVSKAQPSVAYISRERAYRYATTVGLWPGRTVIIDIRTPEVISFVQLSDLSRIVYDTNAPLESGQAKVLLLRLIEPLNFEGQTTSIEPTLTVVTTDRAGNLRTYIFNLRPRAGLPEGEPNGVAIVPSQTAESERLALLRREAGFSGFPPTVENTVMTDRGPASPDDIERGLNFAIAEGYTPPSDPIVLQIRELIAQVRNGANIFRQIERQEIRLSVVTALGQLGLERRLVPVTAPGGSSSESDRIES